VVKSHDKQHGPVAVKKKGNTSLPNRIAVLRAFIGVHSWFWNKTASTKRNYIFYSDTVHIDSSHITDQAGSYSALCILPLEREAAARSKILPRFARLLKTRP
jgi:hypothetical protein